MENDTVTLGRYPQKLDSEKESIEWIVLKKEKDRYLCISKHLLDCKPYHEVSEKVTWADCTLRKWLNNEFLFTAFSSEEQEKILLSNVKNPKKDTLDYIFLLCYDEAEKYFLFEERGALTTPYARSQGAWYVDEKCEDDYKGGWWLRYCGKEYEDDEAENGFISCVNFDGYIEMAAQGVEDMDCCIRPAFWLKIE